MAQDAKKPPKGKEQQLTKQEKELAKKKRRRRKIILLVIEILVIVILAVALFAVVKVSSWVGNISQDVTFDVGQVEINEDISSESQEIMSGYTTIAIFGLDAASNKSSTLANGRTTGRSDVIMLACIDNATKEVKLVSVYRDTYLDIGSGSYQKANAAYSKGGATQALSMLNRSLDLQITDYVTVDFNAVVECVDLLGGIEMTITDDEAVLMWGYMDEINSLTGHNSQYLTQGGTYVLDGVQACAFARIRATAGDDYKRTERQRAVIAAMVAKAKKSDLSTIDKLITTLASYIDTNMSTKDLLSLVAQVFSYDLGDTTGFPFEKNTEVMGSKGDCVIPCDLESNVVALHQYLYADDDYVVSSTVKSYSEKIISDTGFRQGDGY